MSDLQKFIRQQFFDNQWTRDVDPSSLTEEKLMALDLSFSQIDVKSKLCLLLSFSNAKANLPPEVNKHIESIFLQALDEENNLVKAVGTILHTKQSLGYLNFDISPTNEAFKKNLERLLKVADRWCIVQTPLLAEYLGENVLNSVTNGVSPNKEKASTKRPQPVYTFRKRTTRSLGFRPRRKPESVSVKEAYLEKLKDECQRRRVHVPIPGRSIARQDEADEVNHADGSVFMGSSTLHHRDSQLSQNRKSNLSHTWNRPSEPSVRKPSSLSTTPHPAAWNRTGTNFERPSVNRPIPLTERLAARTSAAANCRKPSGIKLLDFDQLPAFGPKAKQLRKEQMEKERELKKLEKEERLKEQRAAREAAKIARQSERQAQLEARRNSTSATLNVFPLPAVEDDMIPDTANSKSIANHPTTVDLDVKHASAACESNLSASTPCTNLHKPFSLNPTSNTTNFMVRHPLLSATIGITNANVAPGAGTADADEDDDDDEDDDELMLQDPGSGFYKLGISRDFRGFNPSARVSLHGNIVTSSTPSNLQLGFCNNYPSDTTGFASSNIYPLQCNSQVFGPAAGTHMTQSTSISCIAQQQQHPSQQQPAAVLVTSNAGSTTSQRLIAQHSTGVPTIKVVSGSHQKPLIRLVQPVQYGTKPGPNSGVPVQPAQQALVSAPNPLRSPVDQSKNMCSVADTEHTMGQSSQLPLLRSPDAQQSNLSPPFSTVLPVSRQRHQPQPPTSLTPVRIAPRSPALRVMRVTTPSSLAEIRPRIPSSDPQLQVQQTAAQQQTQHLVNIAPASRVAYITQPSQSQTRQIQPHGLSVLVKNNQSAGVQSTTPLSPPHGSTAHPSNATWMLDGRSVILTPVIAIPGSQSPAKIGLLSPTNQSGQACQNSGFIQFVQQPASMRVVPPGSQTLRIVQQQQQQLPASSESELTNPIGDSLFMDQPQQQQQEQQERQNTIHSYGPGSGGMLENAIPNFISPGPLSQTNQVVSIPSSHPGDAHMIVTNSNDTSTSFSSTVKIQDDLCLTEAQVNSVHNLFQGANRVSRPEKAMIVSFIAGARGNPHPEAGNTLRIHLSEYRERVLDQSTGQLMDVAADTYLHMDYSTGKCEKIKYYRNEPLEVLLRLPVQPAALH